MNRWLHVFVAGILIVAGLGSFTYGVGLTLDGSIDGGFVMGMLGLLLIYMARGARS